MALTPPPTAPSTTDPATFASRADALVAWHATNVAELAALQTDVTASSATAIAAANFKGTWASRTGAANVPYCVAHLSKYWMLQSNIADITVKVPGTASEWQEILGAATFAGIVAQGGNLTGAINEARGTVAMHATTMDIWTGKPAILDGTGTALTITGLAAAPQAGARRTIYLPVGTILTNNATIAVSGGANYTITAGDKAEIEAVTTTTFKAFITKADGTAVVVPAATPFASSAENIAGTIENKAVDPLGIREAFNCTGTAPVYACRAWVGFTGVSAAGTYGRSGTTVTVTLTAHGMTTGQVANMTFAAGTGGTATAGSYAVTVIDANTFTITDTASGTITGSPVATRNLYIRGSGNVSSITDNGTGDYTVNFATAMPDANFAVVALTGPKGSNSESMTCFSYSASTARVQSHSGAAALGDTANNSVSIFR